MVDQEIKANKMREIEIEKVVLSVGALGDELEKSAKLLEILTGMKSVKTHARKRIPAFGIRPGLAIGAKVTLRGKKAIELLKNFLESIDNKLKAKQIGNEDFSFGIEEYIEIPGVEYQRDIGMRGFSVTVVFKRKGKRVQIKRAKRGKLPKRQRVTKQEIISYLQNKLKIEIGEGK